MRWAIISEAYTSPLLIISKIKYSKTHFLICTAILSFSYIIHSLKNKKYTTLHYKVVYNYIETKIKRNKSDFYEVNNAKRYFLLKKPKKSILELNLINHLPTITSTSSSSATWTSAIWASRTSSSTSSIWVMVTTWRNRFMVIRIYTRS